MRFWWAWADLVANLWHVWGDIWPGWSLSSLKLPKPTEFSNGVRTSKAWLDYFAYNKNIYIKGLNFKVCVFVYNCLTQSTGVLKNAGALGKKMIFLITDSQIKEEAFLEDIDSLLNTGEVANLYAADEKQELIEAVRPVLVSIINLDIFIF